MRTKILKMLIEGRQHWINPRFCSRSTAVIIASFFFRVLVSATSYIPLLLSPSVKVCSHHICDSDSIINY